MYTYTPGHIYTRPRIHTHTEDSRETYKETYENFYCIEQN